MKIMVMFLLLVNIIYSQEIDKRYSKSANTTKYKIQLFPYPLRCPKFLDSHWASDDSSAKQEGWKELLIGLIFEFEFV